jgi:hypothetical protein
VKSSGWIPFKIQAPTTRTPYHPYRQAKYSRTFSPPHVGIHLFSGTGMIVMV